MFDFQPSLARGFLENPRNVERYAEEELVIVLEELLWGSIFPAVGTRAHSVSDCEKLDPKPPSA